MDDRLTPFYTKAFEFNAHIQHISESTGQSIPANQRSIPYVGNGYFGIEISRNGEFYVKYGRHLSQPIHYQPIVDFKYLDEQSDSSEEPHGKQALVVDYVNGVVHKFQCFGNDFFISNEFYGNFEEQISFGSHLNRFFNTILFFSAHRIVPQVFVQEVKLTNTRNTPFSIDLESFGPSRSWLNAETKFIS